MKFVFFVPLIAFLALGPAARGQTTSTFATPANISIASATFVVSSGQVVITLSDLLTNPKRMGKLVSDLEFILPGLTGTLSLSSASAQQITVKVAKDRSFTLVTDSTGLGTFSSSLLLSEYDHYFRDNGERLRFLVQDVSAAPEPGTLVLFGTGLLILAKVARRSRWRDTRGGRIRI